jgi:SAM-dependent methyltransferase
MSAAPATESKSDDSHCCFAYPARVKDAVLPYLCCPVSRSPLELDEVVRDPVSHEIISGTLKSFDGRRYQVQDGIPQLALAFKSDIEEQTVHAFGKEWSRYDDFNSYMGSPELFCEFTGLSREDIRGRTVLEVGCGGGRWLKVMADLGAREVVGLDFSSAVIQAAKRTAGYPQVHVVRGSALDMPLLPKFDLVVSIGVIHHLADPVLGLKGMAKAVNASHLAAIWVYAREGNELYLRLVKPMRWLGPKLPDRLLAATSRVLTGALWCHIHSVNRLALRFRIPLPMRDYLGMLSRLRFIDVESVVYDQLTPSIARYPTRQEVEQWVQQADGEVVALNQRTGNSWRCHFRFAKSELTPP